MDGMVVESDEPIRKLKDLAKHLPEAAEEPMLAELGDYLASRMGTQISPEEYVRLFADTLADLEKGRDRTDQNLPIRHKIGTYPQAMFPMLISYITIFADAVFPAEFAEEVRTIYRRKFAKSMAAAV